MTPDQIKSLTGKQTSRRNKMALLAQYVSEGLSITWKWQGAPYESRLLISVESGCFVECKSYDEDVRPKLKSGKERESK